MAKRKRTALFEVIQKDKRLGSAHGSLPMPSWYSKGKIVPGVPAPTISHAPPPVPSRPKARAGPSFSETVLGKARQLPLTQTSVGIIAAALLLALSAGLLWLHWKHQTTSTTPNAQAALSGPAHPEVMDVPVPRSPDRPAIQANSPQREATPASSVQTPTRQPNLSYVRIRLYDTQKSAAALRDLLTQHDIPCTVEHNVPGVQLPLYAVIGLQPFPTAGTAEYSEYVARIKANLVAAGDTKALSPRLIKWMGSSAQTE